MIAGLMSVGKSSLVGSLWGEPTLLPAAVRDCTQSNTLLRSPAPGEPDSRLLLHRLKPEEALEFALRGGSFHRIEEFLRDCGGPAGRAALDDFSGREKIAAATAAVRRIVAANQTARVLFDHLEEELAALDELSEFLDDAQGVANSVTEAPWDQREIWLAGERTPDGRKIRVGRLWALRCVELVRAASGWRGTLPILLDTPAVPPVYEVRRAELLVQAAAEADVLLLATLPEPLRSTLWLEAILAAKPALAERVIVVFNQIDTVDRAALGKRDGLTGAFQLTREKMRALKMNPENIVFTCARLPVLCALPQSVSVADRRRRLENVLSDLRKLAAGEPDRELRARLEAACAFPNAGIDALRNAIYAVGETRSGSGALFADSRAKRE
jgi:hypothetical protein